MARTIGGKYISDEVIAEFRVHYLDGGWRKVERMYGNRTDMLIQMIELAGCGPKRKMKNEML